MIKPIETFHFKPPLQVKGDWMIGLTNLEVYNSIFNITKENNKLQLYNFADENLVLSHMRKLEMRLIET